MRTFSRYVVYAPGGFPLLYTMRRLRRDSVQVAVGARLTAWHDLYRDGYRCVRVVCTLTAPAGGRDGE